MVETRQQRARSRDDGADSTRADEDLAREGLASSDPGDLDRDRAGHSSE